VCRRGRRRRTRPVQHAWHPSRRARQEAARHLLLLATPGPVAEPGGRIGDLAEDALDRSELEAHAHAVICPKCASQNVIRQETLRRGGRVSAG
jgi:hypothetical protein